MNVQQQYARAGEAVRGWEDRDSLTWILDALDHADGDSDDGQAARILEDAPHEWADGDERVIYPGKALAWLAGGKVMGSEISDADDMAAEIGAEASGLWDTATRTAFFILRARYSVDVERFLTALDELA